MKMGGTPCLYEAGDKNRKVPRERQVWSRKRNPGTLVRAALWRRLPPRLHILIISVIVPLALILSLVFLFLSLMTGLLFHLVLLRPSSKAGVNQNDAVEVSYRVKEED